VGISLNENSKVSGLKPNLRNVDITVKIANVGPSRTVPSKREQKQHLVADSLVGDETASVVLTVWDAQIGMFDPGDVIEIHRGYTTLYKGSLRLNISRGGNREIGPYAQ